MNLDPIIRSVQRAVGVDDDGKAGPVTWAAIQRALHVAQTPEVEYIPLAAGTVDPRSEKNIATLQPHVQPYARALVLKAAQNGITIKVISGNRTADEQNALFAQGRTAPGNRVTNARAGYSNHNFGIAFDVGVFQGGKYVEEGPQYKAVGALAQELGLEWGGNWKTIVDEPHMQLRPSWAKGMKESEMLAELRGGRSTK